MLEEVVAVVVVGEVVVRIVLCVRWLRILGSIVELLAVAVEACHGLVVGPLPVLARRNPWLGRFDFDLGIRQIVGALGWRGWELVTELDDPRDGLLHVLGIRRGVLASLADASSKDCLGSVRLDLSRNGIPRL